MTRHTSMHQVIDATDSELYFKCGLQKVVPASFLARFAVHHLPNKKLHTRNFPEDHLRVPNPDPNRADRFLLTISMLQDWVHHTCPMS